MARAPTIEDVARVAHVSNMTVSRVINESGQVRPETRERVRAAMAALGYQPNAVARGMRSSLTRTVGFILPDLTNPLNAMITQTVEAVLAEAGLRTFVASTRFDLDREAYYFEQFQSHRVDGIVALLADESAPSAARAIATSRVPVVVVDRDVPVPVDAVLCEHERAMSELVQSLATMGHRRIGLLNGPMSMRPARLRARAFAESVTALGLRDTLRFALDPPPSIEGGHRAAMDLLTHADRPTALIVCSNQNMFGALAATRELGLRIPADLSFAGADESAASALFDPPLTMIERDVVRMGEGAAQLLLDRMRDPALPLGRTVSVPSRAVFRHSCGAPPRDAAPQKSNKP